MTTHDEVRRRLPGWPLTVLAVVVLGVLVGACAAPAEQVDLTGADAVFVTEDIEYVDPPRELDAGTIDIGLDNRGSLQHDLTLEGEAGTVLAAGGGGQDRVEVTLASGTYTAYCSVAGHRHAGMEFELTVR